MIVGSMKKISGLLTALLLFSGCAETMALLGPASTSLGGGNVLRSTISSTVSYGVKKQTGMSPTQHVLSYAEKENFKLIFLGDTVSEGIQEMVWVREDNSEFAVIRYIDSTKEACMLSSGIPRYFAK